MSKNITNKRGSYKTKEIDVQYSFVEVADFQERLDGFFDIIFNKVAEELYKNREKGIANLSIVSNNDNELALSNNLTETKKDELVGISNR